MTPIERLKLSEEADTLYGLMESLPIYATRVGYRTDSSDMERRIGEAAWAASRAWSDSLASGVTPE